MIRIDLSLDIPQRKKEAWQSRVKATAAEVLQDPVVIGVLLVILAAFITTGVMHRGAQNEHDEVQRAVLAAERDSTSLEEDLERAHSLRDQRAEIMSRIEQIEQIDTNRYGVVHAMRAVAQAVSGQDIWISRIQTRAERDPDTHALPIRIRGYSPADMRYIEDLMDDLALSPFLDRVTYVSDTPAEDLPHGVDALEWQIDVEAVVPDPTFLYTQVIHPDGEVESDLDLGDPAEREGGGEEEVREHPDTDEPEDPEALDERADVERPEESLEAFLAEQDLECVDLRESPPDVLVALVHVDAELAEEIVAAREEAPFRSPRDLERLPGIGDEEVDDIRDQGGVCPVDEEGRR